MMDSGSPIHDKPALPPAQCWEVFSRFPNGACVLDPGRRLVACNELWRRLLEPAAALLVAGTPFDEIVAAMVASGRVDTDAAGGDAAWIHAGKEAVFSGRELVVGLRDGRQFQVVFQNLDRSPPPCRLRWSPVMNRQRSSRSSTNRLWLDRWECSAFEKRTLNPQGSCVHILEGTE
jgi:hypothetical protein